MAKRKDFVSDGMVTLRHKYIAENLDALKGDEDTSAAYEVPGLDKDLPVKDQQVQIYSQIRNDLNIRISKLSAGLENEIGDSKKILSDCESALKACRQIDGKFVELPQEIDPEKDPDALTQLEKLRAELFKLEDACKRKNGHNSSAPANPPAPQISLLPELNSLHQMQMFKMGLCFALPLIIGIIAGCVIIAWAVIITWGGV